MKSDIDSLKNQVTHGSPEEILRAVISRFSSDVVVASSLGAEDQVITDMVMKIDPTVRIFVLDTGRLHPETYDTMAKTATRYGFHYDIQFPDSAAVSKMVGTHGINLFYDNIENRKLCCQVRKIDPLKKQLRGVKAWITGLRRSQSVTRTEIDPIEWDGTHDIIKINPLAAWSSEDVWAYIQRNQVPYNPLHESNFLSIGCAPCTRAVQAGEDIRAGRWWWEAPEQKECGLHIQDGKLVRKKGENDG